MNGPKAHSKCGERGDPAPAGACSIALPSELERFRVLSPEQAAVLLGLSEATLERMRYSGDLVALRLSERRIGYRVADLLAWLEARAPASNEAA